MQSAHDKWCEPADLLNINYGWINYKTVDGYSAGRVIVVCTQKYSAHREIYEKCF